MRVTVAPQAATPSSLSPPSISTHPKLCKQSYTLGSSSSFPKLSSLKSTATTTLLRRSCSATFNGPDFHHKNKQTPLKKTPSFRHLGSPQVDVLEPSLLGIRPDPPQWPAREAVIRDCIARRASRVELPVSLRMIKLKQRIQRLEEERVQNGGGESFEDNSSLGNLCNATLCIIKEVQNEAWKIRGLVLDEGLDDGVVGKVQKEMSSSFVWLFREVYAKTPELMLHVMLLTSNFAVNNLKVEETKTKDLEKEEREVGLWNTMVEEANEMKGGGGVESIDNLGFGFGFDLGFVDDVVHDDVNEEEVEGMRRREEKVFEFVSPVRVEIEGDEYGEYYSTNLAYQIGLSQDPNNTLLLSNYAQFLWLVSRDYDRAEECFKRAMQLDSSDAEVVSQYASFLWLVRNDLWGAEERYQQAMAAEPENSFHASKYASFLWNTGAEDTCYPLDSPEACAE